ncbi:MAG: S-layer homology domain-containing protein, partial [Caldisericota bacterium]|nr:S-layer homology domain-containing protein [Caldisericota bacterium]
MLVRALALSIIDAENPFIDLSSSYFGYREIITAFYSGIIVGSSENGKIYFKPLGVLTRGDAAILMGKAIEAKE